MVTYLKNLSSATTCCDMDTYSCNVTNQNSTNYMANWLIQQTPPVLVFTSSLE